MAREEISIPVQNALTAEALAAFSISPDSLGRTLLDLVSEQCALTKQQEVKLFVLNNGPVLLQRSLGSQGIVEGTVVTFAIRQKKDATEIQNYRRRISGCLSGDGSYHDLVRKLTSHQVEEVAGSVSSTERCLRQLLFVADDSQRWKLLEVASRRGILDTSDWALVKECSLIFKMKKPCCLL